MRENYQSRNVLKSKSWNLPAREKNPVYRMLLDPVRISAWTLTTAYSGSTYFDDPYDKYMYIQIIFHRLLGS